MIQFDAIKVHDLVYLDNNDSLDFDDDGEIEGWHIVTGISQRAGFWLTVITARYGSNRPAAAH